KVVRAGGQVVSASSSDPNLTAYAVLEANGHLDLLVINKSPAGALSGKFQVSGFQPAAVAQRWQYGEAQDTAQSHTSDGHSALPPTTVSLSPAGRTFSVSFPAYSMTVLEIARATPRVVASAAVVREAPAVAGPAVRSRAARVPSHLTATAVRPNPHP